MKTEDWLDPVMFMYAVVCVLLIGMVIGQRLGKAQVGRLLFPPAGGDDDVDKVADKIRDRFRQEMRDDLAEGVRRGLAAFRDATEEAAPVGV